MNQNLQKLNSQDEEKIAGGYFGFDKYTEAQYAQGGITQEKHLFQKDKYTATLPNPFVRDKTVSFGVTQKEAELFMDVASKQKKAEDLVNNKDWISFSNKLAGALKPYMSADET